MRSLWIVAEPDPGPQSGVPSIRSRRAALAPDHERRRRKGLWRGARAPRARRTGAPGEAGRRLDSSELRGRTSPRGETQGTSPTRKEPGSHRSHGSEAGELLRTRRDRRAVGPAKHATLATRALVAPPGPR